MQRCRTPPWSCPQGQATGQGYRQDGLRLNPHRTRRLRRSGTPRGSASSAARGASPLPRPHREEPHRRRRAAAARRLPVGGVSGSRSGARRGRARSRRSAPPREVPQQVVAPAQAGHRHQRDEPERGLHGEESPGTSTAATTSRGDRGRRRGAWRPSRSTPASTTAKTTRGGCTRSE